MTELLQDTHVWYAISFVTFALLVMMYGRGAINAKLDSRIAEIKSEIKTAEELFAQSSQLLAEYQQKHTEAVRECARIKANAEQEADAIRKQAEAEMIASMERRERQLEERLSRMKQSAISEIQQYAADLAAAAAAEIIAKKLDQKTNEKLVDRAIEGVGKNLH